MPRKKQTAGGIEAWLVIGRSDMRACVYMERMNQEKEKKEEGGEKEEIRGDEGFFATRGEILN
jgi:hypothetical protein